MNHQEKVAKAKAKLMLEHPYIGTVATVLNPHYENKALDLICDSVRLKYNDTYFENESVEEIGFLLANDAMHAILKHHERMNNRVGRLWQIATDFVVNSMLFKNGFELPSYASYDVRFEGMYAEEVYTILKEEMPFRDIVDEAEGESESMREEEALNMEDNRNITMTGETVYQFSKEETFQKMPVDKEVLEVQLEQVFQKYNRQENLPQGLHLLVPEYFSHKVDWREILFKYIASYAKSTYTFFPPNMKYLYRGIYLPSLNSDLLRIVIAIDISGSIDERLLGVFLGEIDTIMQRYPNYEIDLITADTKIQSHRVFLPGESLSYEVEGGGGTDFRPVFDYIEHTIDYPTLLLYFTDGDGTFPDIEPGYDLLWVMPEAKKVPIGEVLILEK